MSRKIDTGITPATGERLYQFLRWFVDEMDADGVPITEQTMKEFEKQMTRARNALAAAEHERDRRG